jgi:hypothetical protein
VNVYIEGRAFVDLDYVSIKENVYIQSEKANSFLGKFPRKLCDILRPISFCLWKMEKNFPHCDFVHNKSHKEYKGIELGPPRRKMEFVTKIKNKPIFQCHKRSCVGITGDDYILLGWQVAV